MELDDMKSLWQNYDKALQQNRILNEKLIKEMLQTKSSGSLDRLKNTEYIGILLCSALLIFFITRHGGVGASILSVVSYIVLVLVAAACIVTCVYRISILSSIDLSRDAVADVSYKINRVRFILLKEVILGFVLLPAITIAAFVFVTGIDLTQLSRHIFTIIIYCIINAAVGIFLYKKLYFDNIKQIIHSLKEVKAFQAENE